MIDTADKTFEQVAIEIAEKLIEQGGRCTQEGGYNCVYGDGHGSHCAIGWLFPADSEAMEFVGSIETMVRNATDMRNTFPVNLGPNKDFLLEHVDSLSTLQNIHDRFSPGALATLPVAVQEAFSPWMDLDE